jgi:predicted ribonuclease YlaK
MDDSEPAPVADTINDGALQGPVLQGRDFSNVAITMTTQAQAAPAALAQLPRLTVGFVSRGDELELLAALLDPAGAAGSVLVSAVAGLAGVGKTTLAIAAGREQSLAASSAPGGPLREIKRLASRF